MFSHIEKIRVRYGETDKMGFVYYGNYALYYEIGRVEMLRKLGINYSELENTGIGLPVVEFDIKFLKPAVYDDLISIITIIKEKPGTRITFYYECTNEKNETLNKGKVMLAFINLKTLRPVKCPQIIKDVFEKLN